MRIVLVNMPWMSLQTPSIAVGIIHAQVQRHRPQDEVFDRHANFGWAEYLCSESGGALTPNDYEVIAEQGVNLGVGDWIFTSALYGVEDWRSEEYLQFLRAEGFTIDAPLRMHRLAPAFIDETCESILALEPDLVGFTTTFAQNIASLALARRIKMLRPSVQTVFGGANCDGVMGAALHRSYPFLDFVVRGEGEQAFIDLLNALEDQRGDDLARIEGLCWRADGTSVTNPDRASFYPMNQVPSPSYDSYFAQLSESPIRQYVEPRLVVEAARGCWWGAKHQCTFCGLNPSTIKFRSKEPSLFWAEVQELIRKHHCLDIDLVDNIIDSKYFKTLLPQIAASGWDLRIRYEVKSNLTTAQVAALRDANVVDIQPGIESFSSRVLSIMKKGVSGCQNVKTLRDSEEHGLTVRWNFLYGFPGELEADYDSMIAQIPLLVHLQPPRGIGRIALDRFSPYFDYPNLGFSERAPHRYYEYVYDLPKAAVADLAYLFETGNAGIEGAIEGRFRRAIELWTDEYSRSSLTHRFEADRVVVCDRRGNRSTADHVFDHPLMVQVYRTLLRHHSPAQLERQLQRAGCDGSSDEIAACVRQLQSLGLLFEDAGDFIILSIDDRRARQTVRSRPPACEPEVEPEPAVVAAAARLGGALHLTVI